MAYNYRWVTRHHFVYRITFQTKTIVLRLSPSMVYKYGIERKVLVRNLLRGALGTVSRGFSQRDEYHTSRIIKIANQEMKL